MEFQGFTTRVGKGTSMLWLWTCWVRVFGTTGTPQGKRKLDGFCEEAVLGISHCSFCPAP